MAEAMQNSSEEGPQAKQLRRSQADSDNIEEELLVAPTKRGIYEKVHDMAENFAGTRIGQFVIDRADRVLRVIENTIKWSVPEEKASAKLERTLPWIPFLWLIVMLRIVRLYLSIAAVMIGNAPVTPRDMIYFIQTRRRKLRAIRINGKLAIRRREAELNALRSSGVADGSIIGKLRGLFSSAICRPGLQSEPVRRIFIRAGKEYACEDEKSAAERKTSKRARDEDGMDHDLTYEQLLDKYANEDSADDSDFKPTAADATYTDTSTSTGTSADEHNQNSSNEEDAQIVENGQVSDDVMPSTLSKTDNSSDTEPTLTPTGNGPSNGDAFPSNKTVTAAAAAKSTNKSNGTKTGELNIIEKTFDVMPMSAAELVESVANLNPALATFGATANVSSPPDFNAFFKPNPKLKEAMEQDAYAIKAHSTPDSGSDTVTQESPESPAMIVNGSTGAADAARFGYQPQAQTQQQRQQYNSQHHRYRNRNNRR